MNTFMVRKLSRNYFHPDLLLLQSVDSPPGLNNSNAQDAPVRLRGGGQPKKSKQGGNQRQGSSSKKAGQDTAAAASPSTKAGSPAEAKEHQPEQQAGSSTGAPALPFEYHVGDCIEVNAGVPLVLNVLHA